MILFQDTVLDRAGKVTIQNFAPPSSWYHWQYTFKIIIC